MLERIGAAEIPEGLSKYFFCCPNLDYVFRCMPSAGGLYDQRYKDLQEFAIIENRLRMIESRRG